MRPGARAPTVLADHLAGGAINALIIIVVALGPLVDSTLTQLLS